MPQILMDGREIEAPEGGTVLDAARAAGIYVPTLCYHRKTGAHGGCRVCLVEVEGARGLMPACTTAVREGMVVRTDTPEVLTARRIVVELLFAEGDHDCLTCDKSGRCELQDVAYRLGVDPGRFGGNRDRLPIDDSHRMIVRDPNKCIRCFRCIRGCEEVVVNDVLSMGYRGLKSLVVADLDVPLGSSSCVSCGECVQLCPTGALAERKSRQAARVEVDRVRTTCPYCGVGCQLDLHVDRELGKVVRVTGAEGSVPNDGTLCVKGRFAFDFPASDKRLTKPLIKKDGVQVEVSWDEALDYTAARLLEIRERHGADAISGIGSARDTNESNYATMKLLRAAVGTNNVDHCART